ncbi:DNA methyltransferase (plasmid) [Azospirillum sp. HJ39]|uniref:DNA methyltransferase n=1 Tax=Azospirillum sp. HJ39 TaxID=3159496 RepID=UPI0035566AE9
MTAWHELHHGDCRSTLRWKLRKAMFDSCVTDPPYELGFMGKEWDKRGVAFDPETWRAVYDRLKPGAHLLAFGGTRTFHRIACAIEDAGFEIRDTVMWLYGSGFPKSLDVSKAIDKMAGAEREVVAEGPTVRRLRPGADQNKDGSWEKLGDRTYTHTVTAAATEAARQWEGWGTALKPAFEPIIVARKPLIGTVAGNVLAHGCGALNIDACRIATTDKLGGGAEKQTTADQKGNDGWVRPWMEDGQSREAHAQRVQANVQKAEALGRWPANVIHDGSDEVEGAFAAFGTKTSGTGAIKRTSAGDNEGNRGAAYGAESRPEGTPMVCYGDSGSASRFFYCAKANKADRAGSKHPTVKPIALMRYLCRLATPPGGTVLDPFAGSGSTLQAALEEGFNAVGIEREAEFVADIERRMTLFSKEVA